MPMLSLKLMELAAVSTVRASVQTRWRLRGGRRRLGVRHGRPVDPYTVESCVLGMRAALPRVLSRRAKAVKMAPVDSQPSRSTVCPLERERGRLRSRRVSHGRSRTQPRPVMRSRGPSDRPPRSARPRTFARVYDSYTSTVGQYRTYPLGLARVHT